MTLFLAWGFLIGVQHALEPDHLAAVGSLASRHGSRQALPLAGLFWGIGHAITLLIVSGLALLAHATIPARWTTAAEMLVGVMLVGLGGKLLYKLWRDRVHLHVHRHADGTIHLHAHSHRDGGAHEGHDHAPGLPWRSTLVGLMHGMAGSAAMVVMAGASASTAWGAMAYVVVFSLGAMVGMAALGVIVSVPTRLGFVPERGHRVFHLAVGCLTVGLGLHVVRLTGGALLLGP